MGSLWLIQPQQLTFRFIVLSPEIPNALRAMYAFLTFLTLNVFAVPPHVVWPSCLSHLSNMSSYILLPIEHPVLVVSSGVICL